MEILVTGVTGRIGANVAAALVAQGHHVRGLVWPKDPRVEKLHDLGLELIEGSITSQEDSARATEGVAAVFQAAARFPSGITTRSTSPAH